MLFPLKLFCVCIHAMCLKRVYFVCCPISLVSFSPPFCLQCKYASPGQVTSLFFCTVEQHYCKYSVALVLTKQKAFKIQTLACLFTFSFNFARNRLHCGALGLYQLPQEKLTLYLTPLLRKF